MYQFNVRPLKVYINKPWIEEVEQNQKIAQKSRSSLIGGFAIETSMIPNNGEHVRIVCPSRIWVFKAWRIGWDEIKKMAFKGLAVKLFSEDIDPNSSREFVLLKPLYDQKEGMYSTYNGTSKRGHIEYKQPMYIIDITDKEYILFFEHLDTIIATNKSDIMAYNKQCYVGFDGATMFRKVTTADGAKVGYIPIEDDEGVENASHLIIGINHQSKPVNTIASVPVFTRKNSNEVVEKDFESYYAPNHIIAPLAKYASSDWYIR